METLFKRHFWVINLVGLGLIAWLSAGSINAFVGMLLAKAGHNAERELKAPAGGDGALQKRLRDSRLNEVSGANIAGRSIFFNEEPPAPEEEIVDESATDEAAKKEGPIDNSYEPTALPIKLIGTMVVTPETWSSASVEVEKGTQKVVNVGVDLLSGQAVVYAIRRNYLVLKEGDKLTIAPLFTATPAGGTNPDGTPIPGMPPPRAPTPPPESKRQSSSQQPGDSEGVKKVGDTSYQLDRPHINEKLKDLAALGQQARVVPNYHNGKYEGFRMIGMQGDSLFKNIGFENGDVVQAINGDQIDSPNKALALYDALKNKSRLTVLIDRGGVVKTLRYTIR